MARTATAIHLARRNARETHVRSFGAPDRPVAIPDRDRRAGEDLAGRNDRGEKEQAEHNPALMPTTDRFKHPDRTRAPKRGAKRPPKTRSWRARRRAACARACGPAAASRGQRAKCAARPEPRAAPGAACRRQSTLNRAALDQAAAPARRSTLMADNMPRLAAQSTRRLQSFEAANAPCSLRGRSGLRSGREIKPVRDAFVAERRSLHAPDERLDTFCGA